MRRSRGALAPGRRRPRARRRKPPRAFRESPGFTKQLAQPQRKAVSLHRPAAKDSGGNGRLRIVQGNNLIQPRCARPPSPEGKAAAAQSAREGNGTFAQLQGKRTHPADRGNDLIRPRCARPPSPEGKAENVQQIYRMRPFRPLFCCIWIMRAFPLSSAKSVGI